MSVVEQQERLESWKQIAAYLGKSERTVRRWQQTEELPVHRHQHQQRGSVWAYRAEIDAWLEKRKLSPEPLAEAPEPSQKRTPASWLAAGVALAASVVAVFWYTRPTAPQMLESVPLTTLPGMASGATFSPDGRQVAFFWTGNGSAQGGGVYLKTMGSEAVTMLAAGAKGPLRAYTYNPVWSPDGKRIAFLRRVVEKAQTPGGPTATTTWLYVVTPGGAERLLRQLTDGVLLGGNHMHLSWTPDSQWIVAPMAMGELRGIHRIAVATGELRQLTNPPTYDYGSQLSPDGRALIFLRREGPETAAMESVLQQNLGADGMPVGPVLTLYKGRSQTSGVVWTGDGKDLIVCNSTSVYSGPLNSRLFRLRAMPGHKMEWLPVEASDCSTLSISRLDAKGESLLVFGNSSGLDSLSRIRKAALRSLQESEVFAPSSRADVSPSYSPDGRMVAFRSSRSGHMELWIANRDGTGPRRLTANRSVWSDPVWSPDGTRLLYGAAATSGPSPYGLFLVAATGGRAVQIPTGSSPAFDPFWGPDGETVYYWTNHDGTKLWRSRTDGGGKALIGEYPANTRQPGLVAGGYIYYTRYRAGLGRISLQDGKDEALASMANSYFAASKKYLYFVRSGDMMLCALPLAGGPVKEIGPAQDLNGTRRFITGMSVSPDDSTLLWSEVSRLQVDLMMVRGFK